MAPIFFTATTILATIFMASLASGGTNLPDSTISAAPALLPAYLAPSSSAPPALSPDITPLFPSPGAPQLAPTDSSLPIIPSSPSPPNPDAMAAEGPGMAFAPSGLLPDSSSVRVDAQKLSVVLHLVGFGLVLLFGA